MVPEAEQRLTIHRIETPEQLAGFSDDVRVGLTSVPKYLKPKYFYDEMGSLLFEGICLLPEYYVTRAESEILADQHDTILDAMPGKIRLVELGSGSANKTRILIDTVLGRQKTLEYLPIDVSESALESSSVELLHSFPRLTITAFASDYMKALTTLAEEQSARDDGTRTMALFLGGTIGNLEPPERLRLLQRIRNMLDVDDGLIIGTDLKKERDLLEQAYDDALGVTATFNKNLLQRINRELDGDFDLRRFAHKAFYNAEIGRIEMHLVSRERQTVRIADLDLDVEFDAGESIHTENSYKFDRRLVATMAREAGFELTETWQDSRNLFGLHLMVAR